MIKNCVEQNPSDYHHLCFQWQCKHDHYMVLKKLFNDSNEEEINMFINDTEGISNLSILTKDVAPAIISKFPNSLHQEILPLPRIDMRNTDDEDRILDPTQRKFALIIMPNYYLLCIITIILINF